MLLFALSVAHAGDLVATLDGAPYVVKTAVAKPDPHRPWVWGVLVSDGVHGCPDFAAGAAALETRLVVMFGSATPGAPATFLLSSDAQGADMALDRRAVTVGSVPDAPGPGGTIEVDVAGPRLVINGTVPFELCAPLGERPAMSWGTKASKVTLTNVAPFDEPDKKLKVTMVLPDGWTAAPPSKEDFQSDTRWTAPDGMTVLAVGLDAPPADFAKEAEAQAKATAEAWSSLGATVRRNEAVSAGAWVLEYGPAATRTLEVMRYDPGMAWQVHCTIVSDNAGADAIFDEAKAACVGLVAR